MKEYVLNNLSNHEYRMRVWDLASNKRYESENI